jgi:hypothetical protein
MKITSNIKKSLFVTMLLSGIGDVGAMEGQGSAMVYDEPAHYGHCDVYQGPSNYHNLRRHQRMAQSSDDLYDNCAVALEKYMHDNKKRSDQEHRSYSWLFDQRFKDDHFESIKGALRSSIDLLHTNNHFFDKLLGQMDSVQASVESYTELLTAHNFIDLTSLQSDATSSGQLVFMHTSGLLIRIKPNEERSAISLSLYKGNPLNVLLRYVEKPDPQTALEVRDVFSRKAGNEACKLNLRWTTEGRMIVEPVPHAPYAIITIGKILDQYGLNVRNLRPNQYVRLEDKWKKMVMDMGHLSIKLTKDPWGVYMNAMAVQSSRIFHENDYESSDNISHNYELEEAWRQIMQDGDDNDSSMNW